MKTWLLLLVKTVAHLYNYLAAKSLIAVSIVCWNFNKKVLLLQGFDVTNLNLKFQTFPRKESTKVQVTSATGL